jgi:hypothetical protein
MKLIDGEQQLSNEYLQQTYPGRGSHTRPTTGDGSAVESNRTSEKGGNTFVQHAL